MVLYSKTLAVKNFSKFDESEEISSLFLSIFTMNEAHDHAIVLHMKQVTKCVQQRMSF